MSSIRWPRALSKQFTRGGPNAVVHRYVAVGRHVPHPS